MVVGCSSRRRALLFLMSFSELYRVFAAELDRVFVPILTLKGGGVSEVVPESHRFVRFEGESCLRPKSTRDYII